jgi:hypothetical protein
VERDAAGEEGGELAREREAEARAAHTALNGAVHLHEVLEDALLIGGSDADAGVGDGEANHLSFRDGGDAHLAVRGELERVRDEVAQHLAEALFVGVQRDGLGRVIEREGHLLVGGERAEHPTQRGKQARNAEVVRPQLHLPRFDLRDVEQVADHVRQPLGRALDEPHLLGLLKGERAVDVREEDPREIDHRAEWGAQLVADVGQESRLDLGEPPQLLRAVIELGVQGDDAAIRLGQLLREPLDLRLALLHGIERGHQRGRDALQLRLGGRRGLAPQRIRQGAHVGGGERRRVRDHARHRHDGAGWPAVDGEAVAEAAGADDADAHAGG